MTALDAPGPTGDPPAANRTPLGARRLLRLCRKELRETLRDRRTIGTLILMPLLAYPLLSMAFQRLLLTSGDAISEMRCVVGLADETSARRLERYLGIGDGLLARRSEEERQTGATPSAALPQMEYVLTEDLHQAVASGAIDVGVHVTPLDRRPLLERAGEPIRVELLVRPHSPLSTAGAGFIADRLNIVNRQYVRDMLAAANLPADMPVEVQHQDVEIRGDTFSLTTFVPLILILMTITGAVYPAIDLTAGERERGTLETLMAAPVPRFGLLFAKYVAVLTVAMLTATANLLAMSVTLIATGLGPVVFGPEGPTLKLIDQVFLLVFLFAAFFSAVLLALTSFARSFKEAQAYLIPLMLVTLAPGMMSLMPDFRFTGIWAVTPLVNIVLLARDLLEGSIDPALAAAAVLSTVFYAVAAIALAAKIFGTDAILYGSQATWSDLLRRPDRTIATPSVSGALFCLAVLYPAYFLLANMLYRLGSVDMQTRLLLAALVAALLFVVLPLAAASAQRARWKTAFRLHAAAPWVWPVAVLLGASLWPWAHEVFLLNEFFGLESLNEERLQSVEKMLQAWQAISPWVILFAMALTPAVCEEFFFRGYLMSAFLKEVRPWQAVVITAVLFGVFHVITTSVLATERFLPSTFLGLVLGLVCLRSGSVLPGMILHAVHNGLLLMVAYYRDELLARGWGVEEQSHLPPLWLAASAAVIVVALTTLLLLSRPGPTRSAAR